MADKPETPKPAGPQVLTAEEVARRGLAPRPVDVRVQVAELNLARAVEAASASPAAPVQLKEKVIYVLGAERMKQAEYERSLYVVTPTPGVTIDDLIKPECWAAVSLKLRPWDHVEVRAEDGTYYAEFLVMACDRSWALVHVLNYHALSTPDVSLSQAHSAYEIKHTPNLRWHIVRKSDRHIVKDSMQLRSQAEDALREHLKTVQA
jgi:hypothetical protein